MFRLLLASFVTAAWCLGLEAPHFGVETWPLSLWGLGREIPTPEFGQIYTII